MKEENIKSDFKEDEEYKELPEFIKSMIGNFYNSSSFNNSNSKGESKDSNSSLNIINNNNNLLNNYKISKFNPNDFNKIYNNQIIQKDSNIKIFNIKDSNLAIMKKSFKLRSILQNNRKEYMENTKECSICFRVIINYGLLSNCDDIFCYECIKQWRNEAKLKSKRGMFRRCPICNCESPLLIKSKFYLTGEEKRQKMIEFRQENNNN